MIAMQPTDYELGRRSPADLIDRPEPEAASRTVGAKAPTEEGERRRRLLEDAIEMADSAKPLSDSIDVSTGSISRWRSASNNIPDDKVALLEAWISIRRLYGDKQGGTGTS